LPNISKYWVLRVDGALAPKANPGKLSFASGNTASIVSGRRIISASAENRGNSCQRKHPNEILALGPSCRGRIRLDHRKSVQFQRDILPRHF
jgi:hypothetical protein